MKTTPANSVCVLSYTVDFYGCQMRCQNSYPSNGCSKEHIFKTLYVLLHEIGLKNYTNWLSRQEDVPDITELLHEASLAILLFMNPQGETIYEKFPEIHCLDEYFNESLWDEALELLDIPDEERSEVSQMYIIIANIIIDLYDRLLSGQLPESIGLVSNISYEEVEFSD